MAFDGIVTNSLVKELNDKIVGGRIDKVYQPEKDEIFIHLRAKGKNHTLLLSSSSNNPRFHLTEYTKKNPKEPPMFCMILRKHLVGATILNISQYLMDRVVFIDLISKDELGINREKRLILEIMGRHSNLILIDKETGKIIDSIIRVSEDMSRLRQIFPGIDYKLPPSQDKINPLDGISLDKFISLMEEQSDIKVFKFLYSNYYGLSPLISKEICYRAKIDNSLTIGSLNKDDKQSLYSSFEEILSKIKRNDFKPNLIINKKEDKIIDFYVFDIKSLIQNEDIEIKTYNTISELLDSYFHEKDLIDRLGQKSQSLKKIVQTHLDRAKNKLKYQEKEYQDSLARDKFKIYADLVSANIHNISPGLSEVLVDNFYSEDMEKITIPLDIKLSPALNAQRYYKKYSKLKNASILLKSQIPKTKEDIYYLHGILMDINNSTDVDNLEDIRDELVKEGYIKGKYNKNKKRKTVSSPHHYVSSDGFDILVGKNNRQNDVLTFKNAHREDIWLHIQNMPGSHVIIKNAGQNVPISTLNQASLLAGYYSSARTSKNIPIDYTERKNVKKPKGGKAGLAIYDDFSTIFVSPTLAEVNKIKKLG